MSIELILPGSAVLIHLLISRLSPMQLHESGYTNVDGMDASAASLEFAYAKGLYRNVFECFITPEKKTAVDDGRKRERETAFKYMYIYPRALIGEKYFEEHVVLQETWG